MSRVKQINIRVNEEELARFEAVAEKHGLSVANAIRMLVKLDHDHDIVRRYGAPHLVKP